MKKKFLLMDLSAFFDNAVFEPVPAVANVQIGINGLHLTESVLSPTVRTYDGVDFRIQKNAQGFDNLSCDGQTLTLPAVYADEVCFLGFNEFGTVCDSYIVGYRQNEEPFDFVFKTFHTNSRQGIDNERNNRCITAERLFGSDGQKHGLFLWRQSLSLASEVCRLVLPVNLSIHILAISLGVVEDDREDLRLSG